VLADAEAAEECARYLAMNAESEAEVAEGMAFASGERNVRDEKLRNEYGTARPLPAEETAPIAPETEPNNVDLERDDEDADQGQKPQG
jgi:hypothetical protein